MAAIVALPATQSFAAAGDISTVAGTGTAGFSGESGNPTLAALNLPSDVVTAFGKTYIVDSANNRVRVIETRSDVAFTPSNSTPVSKVDVRALMTLAGIGVAGFGGDGGDPAKAQLSNPQGIAVCSSNQQTATDIYIADTGNHRIRKVTFAPTLNVSTNGTFSGGIIGTISTIAGAGTAGFGGDEGPASAALLSGPAGVSCTATKLYIADTGNNRIREMDLTNGKIKTLAGNGTAALSGDGGPANAASLNAPRSVVADPKGNVWVADTGNHRVRVVSASTSVTVTPGSANPVSPASGTISSVVGNGGAGFSGDGGPALGAGLSSPSDIAVSYNTFGDLLLLIADTGNNRVRKVVAPTSVSISTSGTIGLVQNATISTVAGTGLAGFGGDGGAATAALLSGPKAVSSDMLIADTTNHRIRQIAAS